MQEYLTFGQQLIQEAGWLVRARLHQIRHVTHKSSSFDMVTDVDEEAQRLLVARVQARFPEHGIVAEEALAVPTLDRLTWYIDPLDGTTNYVHGLPVFCVSIALCSADGPLVGLIYAPASDELFWATRGGGAFDRHGPLHVSSVDSLERALVVTGFPYQRAPGSDNNLAEAARVIPHVQGFRRTGSAALDLAFVAAGRFDGFWELYLKPWDTLAGQVLVTEAGGQVSLLRPDGDMHGSGGILATNGRIHRPLKALVRGEA